MSPYTYDALGRAKEVTIDNDNTTIIDGVGTKADTDSRVAKIRQQIDTTTSDYDREKLQKRRAKLAGGVAVRQVAHRYGREFLPSRQGAAFSESNSILPK